MCCSSRTCELGMNSPRPCQFPSFPHPIWAELGPWRMYVLGGTASPPKQTVIGTAHPYNMDCYDCGNLLNRNPGYGEAHQDLYDESPFQGDGKCAAKGSDGQYYIYIYMCRMWWLIVRW